MEQKLLFLINREWTNPFLDWLMATVTSFNLWLLPLGVAVLLIAIFGGFKGRAMLVVLTLLVGVGDGLLAAQLKRAVQRSRPHEVLANVRRVQPRRTKPPMLAFLRAPKVRMSRPHQNKPGSRSFPSAHTLDNFCAAVVLMAFNRRWGWLWFLVAALIGWSRIYVGAHWPSDVAISALMGIGLALIALPLVELLWRKAAARVAPGLFERHPTLIES